MNDLERFEAVHGKPLYVGMSVTVDPSNQYASEWQGQFVVLGIQFQQSRHKLLPGGFNITIGDDWNDSGCDGWKPDDLRPAR